MNIALVTAGLVGALGLGAADEHWVVYEGSEGPGEGRHIVLISGDEEYRSEEALPQLGKILAKHHGFKCTVLFAIDPETGEIDPNNQNNIPGLEALESADLMIIATRFRNLPAEQMAYIVDYVESGKPVIGLRTATHAFNIPRDKPHSRYSFNSQEWDGGFGRQVLGETWISHHGKHKVESTRGIVAPGAEDHPIARGIEDGDIWGPTDVYGVRLPLPGDSTPIILGQVLAGMNPDDPPVETDQNDPILPVAWTKTFENARIFTSTMGAATDFESEGLRRLLVNACYWCLGMEDEIPKEGTKVDLVGEYEPNEYSFDGFKRGLKPSDFALSPE